MKKLEQMTKKELIAIIKELQREAKDKQKDIDDLIDAVIERAKGFKCPECSELYDEAVDALMCCNNNEVDGWRCKSCDEVHNTKMEAFKCCNG